jgi:hypothetical protein
MARERRLFSEEFKREAVKLLNQPGTTKAEVELAELSHALMGSVPCKVRTEGNIMDGTTAGAHG